jgi:Protein of unknown function DUF58
MGALLPLTTKGYIFLAFSVALLAFVGISYSDIVATLAASLAGTLVFVCILLGTYTKRLLRNLTITVTSPQNIFATEKFPLQITASFPTIPIGIFGQLKIALPLGRAEFPLLYFSGAGSTRSISCSWTLPHRGVWHFLQPELVISDVCGLTTFKTKVEQLIGGVLSVQPAVSTPHPLPPIVSSTTREGDLLPRPETLVGEPYEIKRYHPSDGLRKILWKIFARSGELMSRHEEPSVTPEGKAVVYVMANHEEDVVCSEALRYALYLERHSIELYLGCEGIAQMPLAKSTSEAKALLVDSVWFTKNTNVGVATEFLEFLQQAKDNLGATGGITTIVLFVGSTRLQNNRFYAELERISRALHSQQVAVWCQVVPTQSPLLPSASPSRILPFFAAATEDLTNSNSSMQKLAALGWNQATIEVSSAEELRG